MNKKEINLSNLDNITDEEIIENLKLGDKSSLTLDILFYKNTDLTKKLFKRVKSFNNDFFNDYIKYIAIKNWKLLEGVEDEITNPIVEKKLPKFPTAFSADLSKFAEEVSESLQVPIDMVDVSILGILSICLQKNYIVNIKPDWSEQLSLYLAIIAPPSERKSAVFNILTKPLIDFEIKKNEELKSQIILSNLKKTDIENKKSKKGISQEKLEELATEIANFKEVTPVKIFIDDVTIEKITEIMKQNHNCISVVSTEGGIFDTMLGRYNNKPNFDIFLKAYSGDTIRVDRINRESETILNPKLSILLAIQPHIIDCVLKDKDLLGKGLISRFLYSYPDSIVGKRKFDTIPISEELKKYYNNLIYSLLRNESNTQKVISFNEKALEALKKFYDEIEEKLASEYSPISTWAGKLLGNTSRIACILELSYNINANEISENSVLKAIKIAEYFLETIKYLNNYNLTSQSETEAKHILDTIKKFGLPFCKNRNIVRDVGSFGSNKDAEDGIKFLVERNYLYYDEATKLYHVNPKLYD